MVCELWYVVVCKLHIKAVMKKTTAGKCRASHEVFVYRVMHIVKKYIRDKI